MNKNTGKSLLSISEAAQYLGVSPMTLRRWHDEGSFPATFVSPGGHRYYALSDLQKRTKGLFQLALEWAASEDPYIPDSEHYCETADRFKARLHRMAHALSDSRVFAIAPLLSSAAGEIGNNSFDHNLGHWPDVIGVFFAYDAGKREIVLADRGVGVLSTLSYVKPDLTTDAEALRTAFTEIITGRSPESRGNGLKYVRKALHAAGANLFFLSGDAVLELKNEKDELIITPADTPVRGCIARISYK
jgi:excisionase family DNA binding protein